MIIAALCEKSSLVKGWETQGSLLSCICLLLPSHVWRILLLESPTAAIQLCRICRAHTVADTEALISPVPLHLRLHGTGLQPLHGRHRRTGWHQRQPRLSRSRASSARARKPSKVRLPCFPTPQAHAEKAPGPHRWFGPAHKHFLEYFFFHLQHRAALPP